MKRITILLFILFTVNLIKAGDTVLTKRDKYINAHKDDAIRDMQRTGVPASITLAQACLESQDGSSALARHANNHFGIKCSNWTGPSYIQDDDKKDECFRKYNTTLESYDDHSEFLRTRPRYSFLFELPISDYKGWAKGLKKAGYATDPSYATRLIKIIEENQLYQFDVITESQPVASIKSEREPARVVTRPKKVYVPSVDAIDVFSSRQITAVNGVECIVVKKGDDLESLAKEFSLGFWQLPKYNEISNDTPISEGQIIFIKPKRKEGTTASCIAKPGDTIESIAQENGVKAKYVYKYNNLDTGARLEPGQEIFLKKHR